MRMPNYDFMGAVREEIRLLQQELEPPAVADSVREVAARTGADERVVLAALWRTSKRHGETLAVFATELTDQFQREAAAATSGAGAAA
jgi:hypothetical protein